MNQSLMPPCSTIGGRLSPLRVALNWTAASLLLIVGLQFAFFLQTQNRLAAALTHTSTNPEFTVLAGNRDGYVSELCMQLSFIVQSTCREHLLVEMGPINRVSADASIVRDVFMPGAAKDLIVLKAAVPVVRLLPVGLAPWAYASITFRRR